MRFFLVFTIIIFSVFINSCKHTYSDSNVYNSEPETKLEPQPFSRKITKKAYLSIVQCYIAKDPIFKKEMQSLVKEVNLISDSNWDKVSEKYKKAFLDLQVSINQQLECQ